jgi:hypothetical protein
MKTFTDDRIEYLRNYTRLNAKSLTDIHTLYVEVLYELTGLVVNIPEMSNFKISLEKVDNYHSCPVFGVTNWGNNDKTKPNHYPGWRLNNIRGTMKDEYGDNPTLEYVNNIDKKILKHFSFGRFDEISLLDFQYGINTGSFNGGYNFMGCFVLFVEDFPLIMNNLCDFYDKKHIEKIFNVDDYNYYLRANKLKQLKNKLTKTT